MMELKEMFKRADAIHEVVSGMDPNDFNLVCQVVYSQLVNGIPHSSNTVPAGELAAAKPSKPKKEKKVEAVKEAPVLKAVEAQEEEDEGEVEYDRNGIKLELDALGIKYTAKSSTKTLFNILRKHKEGVKLAEEKKPEAKKPAPKVEAVKEAPVEKQAEAPLLDPTAEESNSTREVTIEEAREALKQFALSNSQGAALALLQDFGASKLSDLSAEQRVDMVVRIEKGRA